MYIIQNNIWLTWYYALLLSLNAGFEGTISTKRSLSYFIIKFEHLSYFTFNIKILVPINLIFRLYCTDNQARKVRHVWLHVGACAHSHTINILIIHFKNNLDYQLNLIIHQKMTLFCTTFRVKNKYIYFNTDASICSRYIGNGGNAERHYRDNNI